MTTSTSTLATLPAGETTSAAGPARWRLIAAFASVYLIWGSTYLGILIALETLPPFLMAGSRFLVAGALLYAWSRGRGAPQPARHHWLAAAVVGGLMLAGGNGGVVWAEQRVATGPAALMVAIVPLWMVLLEWRRGGVRPTAMIGAGLALGLVGIALLVGPTSLVSGEQLDPLGAAVLIGATLCWATGSIYSRQAKLPASPLLTTGMEMLAGGALLTVMGLAAGEGARLNLAAVSTRSLLALGYLIVFGSLVGFTAYIWLLRVTTPARAATYAYVNPVVAVLLGWAFAHEPLSPRTLLAAAVIIGAVVLITASRQRGR